MARPAAVVDTDLGYKEILAEIRKLKNLELLIGVQEGSVTSREKRGHHTVDAGINIAQYAAENEFGTREIPQRSFMRSTFDENINNIEKLIESQFSRIEQGKKNARDAVGIVGTYVQDLIKQKIRQIVFPPNSALTIARKGSSKPLIDFGFMIASIRYVIKKIPVK